MKIELPLDGTDCSRVRAMARVAFNSQYALEILVHIAQEDRFYQAGIVEAVRGVQASHVKNLLGRLESEGLIEREPKPPGPGRQYFRRRPSPLWKHSLGLATDVLKAAPPSSVAQLRPQG